VLDGNYLGSNPSIVIDVAVDNVSYEEYLLYPDSIWFALAKIGGIYGILSLLRLFC
jgi:hypothetical protein